MGIFSAFYFYFFEEFCLWGGSGLGGVFCFILFGVGVSMVLWWGGLLLVFAVTYFFGGVHLFELF